MTLTDPIQSETVAPRILRIVGDNRSGTTVIGTILGQLPSATFVGELVQVWRAFTTPDWHCSCGQLLTSCPFWSDVRLRSNVDARFDVDRLRDATERYLRVRPIRLMSLVRRSLSSVLVDYAQALECVYRATAITAGAELIVDSSKSAPELLLALRAFRLDLDVLHIVRDPRAVAHSRSRQIPTMQPVSRWMPSEGAIRISARWSVRNILIEAILARYASAQHRMRYEDFVTDFTREIRSLRSLNKVVDTTYITELLTADGQIAIKPGHVIDGNTRVLQHASHIQLRLDDEWKSAMPLSRQAAVCTPAFPLMLFYGYCASRTSK